MVVAVTAGAGRDRAPDRVARILRSRPHIKPSAYAGNTRLFHGNALPELRRIVNVQDARRSAKAVQP